MKEHVIKKNRHVTLNRAKDYYKNDKERLKAQARQNYTNLSEEEKNKKREYGRKRHHTSNEKKQKLKEYQKNLPETKQLKYKCLTFFLFIV